MSNAIAEYLSESVSQPSSSDLETEQVDEAIEVLQELKESFILFELSGEAFSIELSSVCEIVEHEEPCVIPTTNEISAGVINLRGQVIPVLNLAKRLGLNQAERTRNSCILLVEVIYAGQVSLLGLMIDRVLRIVDVEASAQSEVPKLGVKIPGEFVKSMLSIDEAFIPAINLNVTCNLHNLATLILSDDV